MYRRRALRGLKLSDEISKKFKLDTHVIVLPLCKKWHADNQSERRILLLIQL